MCLSRGGLPEGWTPARIGDIVNLVNGFAFKPSHWKGRGLPIIRIQNLNNSDAPFNHCPDSMPAKYLVATSDLLFAWSGTPGTSFGAHVWKGPKGLLNQHIFRVDFNERLLNKGFLRLAINHNLDDYIAQAHGGVGLAHITKSKFENSFLSLPPLTEQNRIVFKVERCLAHVNAARDHLRRAPAILKRFRQAVLAAACSGRLTEDWRERQGKLAEGSAVLESILQKRQRVWHSQQLEALRSKGQIPSENKWLLRYKPPRPAVADELPELPETWTWASVESLSTKVVDGVHKTPRYVEQGIPFVTVRNLTAGRGISFDQLNYITKEDHTKFIERANPENGDILVSKDGTLGVIRAIRTDRPFSIFVSVALIKLVLKQMTDYMELALSSSQVQRQMVGTGSGLQHIHLRDLRSDCVPLPPLEEQQEIVSRVRALFALADAIEQRVAVATKPSDKLAQSILAKAFRGELVATEAELARREGREYEPASVLLERIKKERVSEAKPSRMKRGARKASAHV
jgi:type I restriction enzyme S subunit